MSPSESGRESHRLYRRLRGLEGELTEELATGGPELPQAVRTEQLKAAFMDRGEAVREQASRSRSEAAQPIAKPRVRVAPAFARVAVVTAAIIALLAGLGIGSATAMPGNPLYSVKRAAEAAYVSLVPGDRNKADTYTSLADRRLDELEYAEDRGMSGWYYALARDAEKSIENAHGKASGLDTAASERVRNRARASALRLEALLGDAAAGMTPEQEASLERGLQRVRKQLRMQNGSPPSPSEGPQGPGPNGNQQDGSQGTEPGGPQNQQGGPEQQPGK